MLVRVAQCTSTQLNSPLFFVRKRYWVLCGELANESLIRIEKFVRNITDLEMFFLTVIFQVTTFLAIQKYTAIINTKYPIDKNFVVHDFRRL